MSPWWCTGSSEGADTICAYVLAENESRAKDYICSAYDENPHADFIRWRFCEEKDLSKAFSSDRFPRADWMRFETHDWTNPRNGISRAVLLDVLDRLARLDPETGHIQADSAILGYLDDAGITQAFEKVPKYYA